MLRQVLGQQVMVGQLLHLADAVHQNDLFKLFIGGRIANHAHERCKAGAGGEHEQAFAGQQVVDQQGAGRFAPDDDAVADLNVLQARSQRAIGHLDAKKLQVFLIVGADDTVGAQQRLAALALEANHREVAVGEPQRRVACGGEREQLVSPVMHAQHALFVECTHGGRGKVEKVLLSKKVSIAICICLC